MVPPESVKAALERLLASQTLGSAKRSAALLEFLVRAVLEGRARELKEYTLGAEALGRGKDYDPRTDPIARVEASRLRGRLELYYATEGATDDVVILLPKGSYVPQIERRATKAPAEAVAASARAGGWRRVAVFAGLLVGAVVLGVFLSFAAPWRAPADGGIAAAGAGDLRRRARRTWYGRDARRQQRGVHARRRESRAARTRCEREHRACSCGVSTSSTRGNYRER